MTGRCPDTERQESGTTPGASRNGSAFGAAGELDEPVPVDRDLARDGILGSGGLLLDPAQCHACAVGPILVQITRSRSPRSFSTWVAAVAGCDLSARHLAAKQSTNRCDFARNNLDSHPKYILAAYTASGTRTGRIVLTMTAGRQRPRSRPRRRLSAVDGKRGLTRTRYRLAAWRQPVHSWQSMKGGAVPVEAFTRWLYRSGRPNSLAKAINAVWARAFATGRGPSSVATLEVVGRKSGKPVRLPVVIADLDGERYLVSMLGNNTNWVRNVRAAGHRAVLLKGSRTAIRLDEIPVEHRAPIIKRYCQVATSGRVHIPVDPDAPISAFESVATRYPVFRIVPQS